MAFPIKNPPHDKSLEFEPFGLGDQTTVAERTKYIATSEPGEGTRAVKAFIAEHAGKAATNIGVGIASVDVLTRKAGNALRNPKNVRRVGATVLLAATTAVTIPRAIDLHAQDERAAQRDNVGHSDTQTNLPTTPDAMISAQAVDIGVIDRSHPPERLHVHIAQPQK